MLKVRAGLLQVCIQQLVRIQFWVVAPDVPAVQGAAKPSLGEKIMTAHVWARAKAVVHSSRTKSIQCVVFLNVRIQVDIAGNDGTT